MRITHLLFAFPNGGQENLLIDIANLQVLENHVEIIIVNDWIDENLLAGFSNNIKITRINRSQGSRSPFSLLKLNFLLYNTKSDVYHFHDINLIRFVFLKFVKNRSVLTLHNTGLVNSFVYQYKQVYVISNSVYLDVLNSKYASIIDKVFKVFNGVDFSIIEKKDDFSFNKDLHIVQVGRILISQKGQDILLNALSVFKNKYQIPFKCDIIGGGNDLEKLKKLAIKLNISESVNFLDNKPRAWVYKNLKKYDVLVQPSRFEGFGLTVVEALAARLPVISSNIEGPKEILDNPKYGFNFDSEDYEDLAHKLYDCYCYYIKNKVETQTLNAFNHAISNYSIVSTEKKYITNYKKI
jgi:glycosyltransferase involved in cell wall biosynthesis